MEWRAEKGKVMEPTSFFRDREERASVVGGRTIVQEIS